MPERTFEAIRDHLTERLLGVGETQTVSLHVALDTMTARRLRAQPDEIRMLGFVLFDTGDYEPIRTLTPLDLFWRMQGMDILGHTRNSNRERRARPRRLPMTGSVWLVDAVVHGRFRRERANAAGAGSESGRPEPVTLRIREVHALDRVAIVPGGPRLVESIDIRTMLPRFAEEKGWSG